MRKSVTLFIPPLLIIVMLIILRVNIGTNNLYAKNGLLGAIQDTTTNRLYFSDSLVPQMNKKSLNEVLLLGHYLNAYISFERSNQDHQLKLIFEREVEFDLIFNFIADDIGYTLTTIDNYDQFEELIYCIQSE